MAQDDTIGPDTEKKDDVEKAGQSHIEMLRKEQTQIEIDPKMDARLTWMFDLRIIPWIFGIWFVSFLSSVSSPKSMYARIRS